MALTRVAAAAAAEDMGEDVSYNREIEVNADMLQWEQEHADEL